MRSERPAAALAAALLAALVFAGCGDDDGDREAAQRPATETATGTTARETPPVENPGRSSKAPPPRCADPVALDDPAGDADPAGDLRRFELRADRHGVCAVWHLAEPPPPGTVVDLVVHGPPQKTASGAIIQHGHGFSVELDDTGGTITYGLDRLGSRAPRVLRGRVARTGAKVSAFVPRAQLDRPPANMPDRPPFPYRGFFFEARATPAGEGASEIDHAPARLEGEIGYVNGELCPAPCAALQGSPSSG